MFDICNKNIVESRQGSNMRISGFGFLIGGLYIFSGTLCVEEKVVVHIFVHGTRLPVLMALSPLGIYRGTFDKESWYAQLLAVTRENTTQFDAQPMQERGLIEVTNETITSLYNQSVLSSLSRRAAVQVIGVYNTFVGGNKSVINKYYTFGWSGILDAEFRKKEASILYDELINLRTRLKKEFPHKKFECIINAYSHGGNVALNLAYWEIKNKRDLEVVYLILYGTPIQQETESYINSRAFKKILNIYAHNDSMQVRDSFSTKGWNKRRLVDNDGLKLCNGKSRYRVDICVSCKSQLKEFSHNSFFWLDRLSQNSKFSRLRPLPIVAFAPLIMQKVDNLVEKTGVKFIDFDVRSTENTCSLLLSANNVYAATENLYKKLSAFRHLIDTTWRPYALGGFARNFSLVKTAASSMFSFF